MALKAQWAVTVEIIPGTIVPELTRVWHYTSEHYEMDLAAFAGHEESVESVDNIFRTCVKESADYAMSVQDPSAVNIVKLQFMWM